MEVRVRRYDLVLLLDRQHPPLVGERMDHDRSVLARLDDLVEIADRTMAHGKRERPVLPSRALAVEEIAPDEIGCGHVLVAGHGNQRQAQPPRHVLDEARLADARWPFEHDRNTGGIGGLVDGHLIAVRPIVRLRADEVLMKRHRVKT